MAVTYNKYSLSINEEPTLIKSATLHYFRCPGEKVWYDRLSKLKAAGYNTVDLYFCWNYHSQKEGEYDFSGLKDVEKLLGITQELGLFIIARPGPFINAEITAGGLPFWLLSNKDVIPRNRKEGNYIRSEKYMQFVNEWYDQIIPKLNKYENVIAFQIENEYSTNMAEPNHIQELYALARKKGVSVPLFHNDAYCAGLYADIVDIYACDIYPYISPEQDWKQDTFSFDTLDHLENNIRMYKDNAPIFIAEMQGGWFDKWCGIGYEKMRKALGREHINIVTKTALSQGVTMFNHYMGCGGTSWGDMACDEVYSSYEFTAPIAENGIPQDNYYEAKEINYFLDAFNLAKTDACEDPLFVKPKENIYCKTRKDNINLCKWLFIRNLNATTEKISAFDFDFELKPFSMKILPYGLNLKGCRLDLSSMQIMGKISNSKKESLLIILEENNALKISDYDSYQATENIIVKENGNSLLLAFSAVKNSNLSKITFQKNGLETEFIFVDKKTADKTWVIDNKFIIGPEILWANSNNTNELAISQSSEIKTYDLEQWSINYIETKHQDLDYQIKKIRSATCAHEIDIDYQEAPWQVIKDKTDAFSNKIYDEFMWYKTTFEGAMDELNICAKHCFAIFINGTQIFEHNSYCYECLYEKDELLTIQPDKSLLKDKNELTILVQNLGFDKGFSNDTNLPRGLISLKSSPQKDFTWKIKGGLDAEDKNWQTSAQLTDAKNSYMHYVEMEFDVNQDKYSPLYLSLEDATFNRATIYLNGQKVGRYIKSLGPQQKFFLMDAFTLKNNKLGLIIWLKSTDNQQTHDFKFDEKNVKIKIGSFRTFHKAEIKK